MKFLSILTVLLVLIIVNAQSAPLKVGPKVKPLGVKFEGYYKRLSGSIIKIDKQFTEGIAAFNEEIPKVAKEDGTDPESVKWLLEWNKHYESLVNNVKANSVKFAAAISKLGKHLGK